MRSDVKIIKGLKDWSPDAAGLIPRGVAAARKWMVQFQRKWGCILTKRQLSYKWYRGRGVAAR